MANALTEQELAAIKFDDIAIETLPYEKNLLILVCEDQESSDRLFEILGHHPYGFKISIGPNGNYIVTIEFTESEYGVGIPTRRNEKNYPPVEKLRAGQITSVTTGFWPDKASKGKKYQRRAQYLPLGELNIGKALSQAKEVHFVTQEDGPSCVVLIFDNWEHIKMAEAMEAYEEFMRGTIGNPTLEIKKTGSTVSLKMWDILLELEVDIPGLKYMESQLSDFLKNTEPKHSFCFALGFPPTGGAKAGLAGMRDGSTKLITLKGYVYKENV